MRAFWSLLFISKLVCGQLIAQALPLEYTLESDYRSGRCASIVQLLDSISIDERQQARLVYAKAKCAYQLSDYETAEALFINAQAKGFSNPPLLYYDLAKCALALNAKDRVYKYVELATQKGLNPSVFRYSPFKDKELDLHLKTSFISFKPAKSAWIIFFYCILFQSIFITIVLLLRRKGDLKANRLLALFMLSFALTLGNYIVYWTDFNVVASFALFERLYIPLHYLFGPLLLGYTYQIIQKKTPANRLLHLILFSVSFCLLISNQYLGVANPFFNTVMYLLFHHWTISSSLIIYGILLYLFIIRQQDQHPRAIKFWLKLLQIAYWGFVLAYIAYYILINFSFFDRTWDYIISVAMSLFMLLISLMGYLQPEIFWDSTLKERLSSKPKYQRSSLNHAKSRQLQKRLIKLMTQDKIYRDNEITLSKLAQKLATNQHHASQIINEQFQLNFYELVNHYRIEEAKHLLATQSARSMNVNEIIYTVGYNNKVSFYKAFKTNTGLTPSEYRKQQQI